jgi:hypothetical protein
MAEDGVLDAHSLPQVRMPNQHPFVSGYPSGSTGTVESLFHDAEKIACDL